MNRNISSFIGSSPNSYTVLPSDRVSGFGPDLVDAALPRGGCDMSSSVSPIEYNDIVRVCDSALAVESWLTARAAEDEEAALDVLPK